MIGGVGQRMLSSVSKRMAGEFFGNVERAITPPEVEEAGRVSETGGLRVRCPGLHRAAARRPRPRRAVLPQGRRGRRRAGAARRARRPALRTTMSAGSDLTVASSARSMVAAVADGTISAAELMDLHLARIAERNPELNAVVSLDEERARDGAAAADRVPADRARSVARTALRVQGHPRRRRMAHHVRLAAVRRPRARGRRAGRRPHPGRGRRTAGEDERAGVRGRLPHVQHDLRHHAQPGRPDPLGRRLQRRRRVRAGRGHGAARGRLGHGRVAAQPGVVLRRRRAAALARPGPVVADDQPLGDHGHQRSARAHRGRRGAAAVRDRRARPPGADRARGAGARVRAGRCRARWSGSGSRCRSTSAARSRWTRRWRRWSRPPLPS